MNSNNDMSHDNIDYSDVFIRYLLTLQSGAMVALGKIKNPETNKAEPNLSQAREIINILGMMKQKMDGNLQYTENKLLDEMLTNLRMSYVNQVVEEKSGENV